MPKSQYSMQNNYGFPNPIANGAPLPIISDRVPTVDDFAPISTIWIYKPGSQAYIITNNAGGSATWNLLEEAGGGSNFANLTVTPGPTNITGTTNINTSGAGVTTIGTGGTGAVAIGNATGNTAVTGSLSTTTSMDVGSTLTVALDASLTNGDLSVNNRDAAATGPVAALIKSRTGGIITTGDALGALRFVGNDGVGDLIASAISSTSSGTIGAGQIASDLQFFTHPDAAGTSLARMSVNPVGQLTINEPDGAVANLVLASTTSGKIIADDGVTANIDIIINAKGTGAVGQTRSEAGVDVEFYNVNSDNTNVASNANYVVAVGGTSAGDPFFNALISGGQTYSFGIDNSTANDDFVVSKSASLGTSNVLSFDGTSDAATFTGRVQVVGGAQFLSGTGDPSGLVTAPKGSIYSKTDATTTTTRLWVNTNSGTTWAFLTTSA